LLILPFSVVANNDRTPQANLQNALKSYGLGISMLASARWKIEINCKILLKILPDKRQVQILRLKFSK
tara:strand:- start:58 stop:261 length:204 start_codon:yes stop_codon:yes gene_type:complete